MSREEKFLTRSNWRGGGEEGLHSYCRRGIHIFCGGIQSRSRVAPKQANTRDCRAVVPQRYASRFNFLCHCARWQGTRGTDVVENSAHNAPSSPLLSRQVGIIACYHFHMRGPRTSARRASGSRRIISFVCLVAGACTGRCTGEKHLHHAKRPLREPGPNSRWCKRALRMSHRGRASKATCYAALGSRLLGLADELTFGVLLRKLIDGVHDEEPAAAHGESDMWMRAAPSGG